MTRGSCETRQPLLTIFCFSFSFPGQGGVDSLLRVTPSELAKHNTREDCWQVYAGRVYNVGPFLRYHPGGVGEMMRGAGKDGEFCSFARSLVFSCPEELFLRLRG
mgnify:FL=1